MEKRHELEGVYALWKREIINYFRAHSRIIGSVGMPLFIFIILGSGLTGVIDSSAIPGGEDYLTFLAPGIIAMSLMFASTMAGVIVIMDRQFGFLKETLVAPIRRVSIVTGKALGGATTSMIQGTIVLCVALLVGANIEILAIIPAMIFMFLVATMFVTLGIAIASTMEDFQGFQLIITFLVMPMFFLSGAMFPLDSAPEALQIAAYLDPLTYAVEGLRDLLTSAEGQIPFYICLGIILLFDVIFSAIAIRQFSRIEE